MFKLTAMFIGLGTVFYFAFGIFQFVLGFMGIEYHLGTLVAVIAVIASLFFRIGWPMTIGTFFGAMHVLGLHWFWALCLTLPGIVFLIPGAAAMFLAPILSRMRRSPRQNREQPIDEDVIEPTSVKVDEKGNKIYDV
jgi:hypothetical protein